MTSSPPSTVRAFVVWGAAVAAYAVAVLHRSSFGVAGLVAADRFGVSASVLASLAVAQLVVYACLQVPVGVMLGPAQLETTPATSAAVKRVVTIERRSCTMPLRQSGPPPTLGGARPRV